LQWTLEKHAQILRRPIDSTLKLKREKKKRNTNDRTGDIRHDERASAYRKSHRQKRNIAEKEAKKKCFQPDGADVPQCELKGKTERAMGRN